MHHQSDFNQMAALNINARAPYAAGGLKQDDSLSQNTNQEVLFNNSEQRNSKQRKNFNYESGHQSKNGQSDLLQRRWNTKEELKVRGEIEYQDGICNEVLEIGEDIEPGSPTEPRDNEFQPAMAGYTTDANTGKIKTQLHTDNDDRGIRSSFSENQNDQGAASMGGASMFRQSVGDDSYSASQSRNTFPKVNLQIQRNNQEATGPNQHKAADNNQIFSATSN